MKATTSLSLLVVVLDLLSLLSHVDADETLIIPPNYSEFALPLGEGKLTQVNLTLAIHQIYELDPVKGEMGISFHATVTWFELRIKTNYTNNSSNRIHVNPGLLGNKLWSPMLVVDQLLSDRTYSETYSALMFYPEKKILEYTFRQRVRVSCQFELDKFPFDEQVCFFRLRSYWWHEDEMRINTTLRLMTGQQGVLQYAVKTVNQLFGDDEKHYVEPNFRGKNDTIIYNMAGIRVDFEPITSRYIWTYFIPSGLLVFIGFTGVRMSSDIAYKKMRYLTVLLFAQVLFMQEFTFEIRELPVVTAGEVFLVSCVIFTFISYTLASFRVALQSEIFKWLGLTKETEQSSKTDPSKKVFYKHLELVVLCCLPFIFVLFLVIFAAALSG